MSEEQLVRYEVEDGVGWLTLTNPPANAYSYAMMRQLDAAILDARMDANVHVLVLTGEGERFFSAGADIAMLQRMPSNEKYAFCLHANETLNRLEQTPKLVLGALNGHTVGGGLEVALACDLRIARRGAGKLGLPEVHLGVLPGTGGTQRLSRAVGKARAIELMTAGETFPLERGEELGLVNQLVDADDGPSFRRRVQEIASSYVPPRRASGAVGAIKRACQTGAEVSIEAGLALERELQQQLFESEDAQEGLQAYAEKREPRFRGPSGA